MGIVHKEVIRANTGDAFVLHCATMHSTVFTEHIVVTNNQFCRLAVVFFVLAIFTYAGELVKMIAFAHDGWAFRAPHEIQALCHRQSPRSRRYNKMVQL